MAHAKVCMVLTFGLKRRKGRLMAFNPKPPRGPGRPSRPARPAGKSGAQRYGAPVRVMKAQTQKNASAAR
jgi:hypothetical protein